MNIDNLHDALNLLDDELIEEVEVLRNKRNLEAQRRMRKWVSRWTGVAASLLLCFVSIYAIGSLLSKGFGGNKKSDTSTSIVGEDASIESENKGNADDKDHFEQVTDGSGSDDNKSTGTGESTSDAREITVEVTALVREGFVGIVKESADNELYAVGTELTVVLPEEYQIPGNGETNVGHKDQELVDVAFPVGTVVIVRFMMQENIEPNDGTETTNILYADEITFE